MRFKKYTRFHVNFSSNWTATFGLFMGTAFFLRLVYYFGLMSLKDVGIIELLTSALIGICLCGSAVVFLNCLHRDAPGLYGLMGAVQCLLVFILTCTTGNVGRIILAFVWYALTALILLATVGGYLPGRLLAAAMFFMSTFVRFFFFDLGHIGIIRWVQELAVLCTLMALGCFAMGLQSFSTKK